MLCLFSVFVLRDIRSTVQHVPYEANDTILRLSEGKVGIISDRFYALVHRQVRVQLYPLAGMAHKGEMKTPVPGILHTSKICLKAWLYWIGACHAILGAEVERLVVPLAVDIDNIIELRILSRWLDLFRLQNSFDEFIRLRGDFHFQRFGERSRRCFAWVHRPRIDFLWHQFLLVM